MTYVQLEDKCDRLGMELCVCMSLKQHYATICHFLRYVFMSNYFWYHLQIYFDCICPCEGQINTPVILPGRPGHALCSYVVQIGTPWENVTKSPTISPKDTGYHVDKLLLGQLG